MIKFIKMFLFARFRSLKVSMLYALTVAMLMAFCTFLSLKTLSEIYINDKYLSDESRLAREEEYLDELQLFVDSGKLTSNDTDVLASWVRDNRYLYVMIYKDDQLLLDSESAESIKPPAAEEDRNDQDNDQDIKDDDSEDKGENPNDGENGSDGEGENGSDSVTDDGDGTEDGGSSSGDDSQGDGIHNGESGEDGSLDSNPEDSEEEDLGQEGSEGTSSGVTEDGGTGVGDSEENNGESNEGDNTGDAADSDDLGEEDGTASDKDKTEEGENESGDKEDKENTDNKYPETGLTVTFPTREDLIAYAKAKDSYPIEMADGTPLFVSMVDYTEYFYYDLANVGALITSVIIMIIVIMLYFGSITGRITKLGRKVSKISSGDINYSITDGKRIGNDEISNLATNVENMRCSMLERISKEREAIESNNELITSMSHDIRTPLTVLLGYIDVMKMHTSDETMRECLAAAEKTTNRLKEMSDDMFNYFLVFGGEDKVADIEEYDLYTLFDQIVSEKVALMRERGYSVEWERDNIYIGNENRPTVLTDAPKLLRIFDNIFSNLLKYADKSKPVSFYVVHTEEATTLQIVNSILHNTNLVESNHIGLKTCKKLAEMIGAEFSAGSDGEFFKVSITLQNGGRKNG